MAQGRQSAQPVLQPFDVLRSRDRGPGRPRAARRSNHRAASAASPRRVGVLRARQRHLSWPHPDDRLVARRRVDDSRRRQARRAFIDACTAHRLALMKTTLAAILIGFSFVTVARAGEPPRLVAQGKGDKLTYATTQSGDRIPDFSNCGYMGGDETIPTVPIQAVVAPADGDATARIQAAIDYVAGLPADDRGVRGAVFFKKG